jgi:hypothetical protein
MCGQNYIIGTEMCGKNSVVIRNIYDNRRKGRVAVTIQKCKTGSHFEFLQLTECLARNSNWEVNETECTSARQDN